MRSLLFLLLFPLLLLGACGKAGGGEGARTLYDSALYTPRYARGFEILGSRQGDQGGIMLRTLAPWQGADSTSATELFIGRQAPEGFRGQVLGADRARTVVVMSSTHVALLEALGADTAIAGVSGLRFIYSSRLRSRPGVADVGYDGNIDYETLAALQPDLVMLYGVNSASSLEGKLRELAIPYMYVGDYTEHHPLAKAEWLVPLAYVMGCPQKGLDAFQALPHSYDSLRQTVQGLPRPAVMVNAPYRDVWFMPSRGSYVTRLIEDAGGRYAYTPPRGASPTASTAIDLEEAYALAADADVWINLGSALSAKDLRQMVPRFQTTRPMRSGRLYNTTARMTPQGGQDFWEGAIVHPDLVLRDLIRIFHPEACKDTSLYYYQRLQ